MARAIRRLFALPILLLARGLAQFKAWVLRLLKRRKPREPEIKAEIGEGE